MLLGLLASGPGHGYAIMASLRKRTDGVLDVAEGALYPALHRLEDRGLIASEWMPVDGRRRREYRLTPQGEHALVTERTEWSRLAGAIDAVLSEATGIGPEPRLS